MKRLLGVIVRSVAAGFVVGTATFGVVKANEGGNYNCCGTGSTPLAERCRYTDRQIECATDSACSSDGDYRLCCTDACYKVVVD